jgi:hypothetical protein
VRTGPPPTYDAIHRQIARRLRRLKVRHPEPR